MLRPMLAMLLTLPAVPAAAQAQCRAWPELRAELLKGWREVPVSRGMIDATTALVVLASPDGGSFTVVSVEASGRACIRAAGSGWEPGMLAGQRS